MSAFLPFCFSGLGLGIIFIGIQYQKHQSTIQLFFSQFRVDIYVRSLVMALQWRPLLLTSLMFGLYVQIQLLSVVMPAWAVFIYVVFSYVSAERLHRFGCGRAASINLSGPSVLPLQSVTCVFGPASAPPESKPHGVIFELLSEPSDNISNFSSVRAMLQPLGSVRLNGHIEGDDFWRTLSNEVGSMAVAGFKMVAMPIDINSCLSPGGFVVSGQTEPLRTFPQLFLTFFPFGLHR